MDALLLLAFHIAMFVIFGVIPFVLCNINAPRLMYTAFGIGAGTFGFLYYRVWQINDHDQRVHAAVMCLIPVIYMFAIRIITWQQQERAID